MELLLLVDNRENKCLDVLNQLITTKSETKSSSKINTNINIKCENLVYGDFQIQLNGNILFLFERKTIDDLLASIKDGRYKNQKANVLASYKHTQYYYIIEGKVMYNHNPSKVEDKIIHSAIINTQLRDKISCFYTSNWKETVELLVSICLRVQKDPSDYLIDSKNELNQPIIEKQIISKKVDSFSHCWKVQLCQVPDISEKSAESIVQIYPTMKSFFTIFGSMNKEEASNELNKIKITDAKGKQRKISSKIVENIINYILFVE
jgi:ERCC4-type nuclease